MLSNLSNARMGEVHPELARRVRNLADALDAEHISIQVSIGLRTAEQQNELFAMGRTLPGKKVTNASGYQSNHVIGCAVDVYPEEAVELEDGAGRSGWQPDWNPEHASWKRIVALAPTFGLRDGISWHDMPHLELTDIPPEPTKEAQECCRLNGVTAVWAMLNVPTFGEEPPGAISA